MAYVDHFRHADDLIAHLDTFVPSLGDPILQAKYAGFIAITAVTVYELAIKEIFCDFGRKKHKVLGAFTESFFERIHGRVRLQNIREDYCRRYGARYIMKFNRNLETAARAHIGVTRSDFRAAYSNIITWRNDFAHEGKVPSTATYSEVVRAYQEGKAVIHSLAGAMIR